MRLVSFASNCVASVLTNSKRLLYTAFMMSQAKASMTCADCQIECRRFGKHRNGLQRFRCPECGKTYTEEHQKPLGSMTVPMEKAVLALKLLIEGSSVRTVERITDLHRDTICKLLTVAGEKCEKIMAKKFATSLSATWNAMKFGASLGKRKSAFGPK